MTTGESRKLDANFEGLPKTFTERNALMIMENKGNHM